MSVYTILKNKDVRKSSVVMTLVPYSHSEEFQRNNQHKLFINTSKGNILTIFEDIKKSKVTKYLKLMNFFSSDGLCSPEIMSTKTGDILTLVKNKPCSIMKNFQGKLLKILVINFVNLSADS